MNNRAVKALIAAMVLLAAVIGYDSIQLRALEQRQQPSLQMALQADDYQQRRLRQLDQMIHYPKGFVGTVARIDESGLFLDPASPNPYVVGAPKINKVVVALGPQTRFVKRTPKDHKKIASEADAFINSPHNQSMPPPIPYVEGPISRHALGVGSKVMVEGVWDNEVFNALCVIPVPDNVQMP